MILRNLSSIAAFLLVLLAFGCTTKESNDGEVYTNPQLYDFLEQQDLRMHYEMLFAPANVAGWTTNSATFTGNRYTIDNNTGGNVANFVDIANYDYTAPWQAEVEFFKESNTNNEVFDFFVNADPANNTFIQASINYSNGLCRLLQRDGNGNLNTLVSARFPSLMTYNTKKITIRHIYNDLHLFVDERHIGRAAGTLAMPNDNRIALQTSAGSEFQVNSLELEEIVNK